MAVSGSTERSERYFKGFAPGVLEGWSLKVIRILDGCSSRIYVKDEDSPVFQKVHEIDELTIGFEDPYSDSSLKRLRRSLRNLEKLDLKSGDGNLLQLFPRFEDYWNKKFRATLDRPVISKKLFENLVILGLEASRFEIKEKNQPTIEYLEEYWDKVVLQGIGSHLFDKGVFVGVMRSIGIQFRQKHSERTNLAVGIFQFAKSLGNTEVAMDLIGYLEPFYRAWKELNTEEKENLYGAALMVKGRMVKVDPKLGFYTKVEPDFVEDHKKKMSWVEGSGYVILIPASLASPLKLISWLPTGSQDCAMDWFHLLSRKSSKVGWILEEGYTSVPYFLEQMTLRNIHATNVARKLRESVGGDEADLI